MTSVVAADTTMLGASKDNTLINDSSGSVSNGEGALFAGLTGSSGPGALRAVLAFDIAAGIPAGSTITDVQLILAAVEVGSGAGIEDYSLHRLNQDWGEGTSNAFGGRGAPATSGDATWVHTFFDTDDWNTEGGDFDSTASAVESIAGIGFYTWGSTPGLVADVQAWLDDPTSNFGWVLIGNEAATSSARKFASRESSINPPLLTITFVPEPGSLSLLVLASLGSVALKRWRPI